MRRVEAVDALLAEKARAWSVRQLDRFARALVEELNPKTPAGAHERRFLYASPDANGNLVGKFACGATQGALILAVLAAGNGLRPAWRSTRTGSNGCCRTPGTWGSGTWTPSPTASPSAPPAPASPPQERRHPPDSEPWPDTFGEPDQDEADDEPEDDRRTSSRRRRATTRWCGNPACSRGRTRR